MNIKYLINNLNQKEIEEEIRIKKIQEVKESEKLKKQIVSKHMYIPKDLSLV